MCHNVYGPSLVGKTTRAGSCEHTKHCFPKVTHPAELQQAATLGLTVLLAC